jgi:hypothetical protein
MLITIKQDNMENSPAKQTSKITKGERRDAKAAAADAKAAMKADIKANKQVAKETESSSRRKERTKRIGIRQGERTARVEARHSSPAKQKMFGSELLNKENKSYDDAVKSYDDSTKAGYSPTYPKMSDHFHAIKPDKLKKPTKGIAGATGKGTMTRQMGETVNNAGQVIPTGIGDAAPNNAFNASVTPPQPNRAGAPPRNTANLNMGIGVDPNRSNFRNNQAAHNAALAGGGNVPGMQVPQTMAAKKGWIQEGKESGGIEEGGLHKTLNIPEDEKIPRGEGSKFQAALQGKFGKKGERQAKLAETFKNMNKQ